MKRLALLVVPAVLLTVRVWAAVIYVDIDATAGTGDGTSWSNAYTDLQSALAVAQSNDEIRVAEGTYLPTNDTDPSVSFALAPSVVLRGGYAGFGEPDPDARDMVAQETCLSGDIGAVGNNSDNSYHVVMGASGATLEGFTITGGAARDSDRYGGGMLNDQVDGITVRNCVFVANSASLGGGMMISSCTGTIALADCRFLGNSAKYGGGISCSNTTLTITNSVFSGNSATSGGGALDNSYRCSPTVTNCTFSRNSATYGGAVHNSDCFPPTLVNCILSANTSTRGRQINDQWLVVSSVTHSVLQRPLLGAGNIVADPVFVDADGVDDTVGTIDDDLRLQEGSPCIDAADADSAPGTDIAGRSRHDDTGLGDTGVGGSTYVDIGAHEFQGTTAAGLVTVWMPDTALQVGTDVDISWVASGVAGSVTVELSRDGGSTWEVMAASTPNDRALIWTVDEGGMAIPQTDCQVKVSDGSDGSPSGTSSSFCVFGGTWYVDPDAPGPTPDGFSWGTAFSHPQEAVNAASAGQDISVAAGTYVGSGSPWSIVLTMIDGVGVHGGYAGYGAADPDVRDTAAHESSLDGESIAEHVVMGASGATLDGFTITGGNPSGPLGVAAGMENGYVEDLIVNDCVFTRNDGGHGGGIGCHESYLTVSNCVFSDNTAYLGGGIHSSGSCTITVSDCVFSDNTADRGGGIRGESDDNITVSDCVFIGNAATTGGGIHGSDCTTITIANCTFSGNSATSDGGGIYGDYIASVAVSDTMFVGNTATTYGGGIFSRDTTSTFANCILSGNTADLDGGAMFIESGGQVDIVNSTLTGNVASRNGGGLCNYSPELTLSNCVLWGDVASNGPEIHNYSDPVAVMFSVIQYGWPGAGNIDADPLFVDADGADNTVGTPDDDLSLLAGSPCIDAGDGDVAPATDVVGNSRDDDDPSTPNSGAGALPCTDIGAFEFVTGNQWIPTPPSDASDDGGCVPGSATCSWLVAACAAAMLGALLRPRIRRCG